MTQPIPQNVDPKLAEYLQGDLCCPVCRDQGVTYESVDNEMVEFNLSYWHSKCKHGTILYIAVEGSNVYDIINRLHFSIDNYKFYMYFEKSIIICTSKIFLSPDLTIEIPLNIDLRPVDILRKFKTYLALS